MLLVVTLCFSGAAIAQDTFNDVKGNDEAKKTSVTVPVVKKQQVVQAQTNKGSHALVTALTHDKDRRVRRNAAQSLAAMHVKNPTVVKALIRHLNDADPVVRKAVSDGLKKIGPQAIQPLTVVLKKHKNPIVRRQAAILIGEISRAKQPVSVTHKSPQKSVANGNFAGEVAKVHKKTAGSID